jgi:hypothetical protein
MCRRHFLRADRASGLGRGPYRREGESGNPTSRRDRANGQFLSNSFRNATTVGSDVIIVVSWNEYLENSHIEPSQVYGTQSLDILRTVITAWKGTGAAAPASPGGQSLQVKGTVNVRSGPRLSNSVIGQIAAGTSYSVIGQSGDWYAISYNGQTGYVYAPLVTVSLP